MKIGDKCFMNLQEAVGWLLANNALPFQCSASYVADTQIPKVAIINPSPAEIKVGSLVLFADCKIGTVSGVGSNYFIVGPDYTDIKDATVSISGLAINASGKLIVSLTDGTSVDAGRIKMVNNFVINASQHLIVNYNDGTNQDLGALGDYSNVDFTAKTLKQTQPNFTQDISFTASVASWDLENIYNRFEVINNVAYVVANIKITRIGSDGVYGEIANVNITLPPEIAAKIIDLKGNQATDAPSPTVIITGHTMEAYETIETTSFALKQVHVELTMLNYNLANVVRLNIKGSQEAATVGDVCYLSARFPLTLF